MPKVLLGVGSNLGDREAVLDRAINRFGDFFTVRDVSSWFSYPAIGGSGPQRDFLNGALVVLTDKSAHDIHAALQIIEQEAGRERVERWSSRTLDCDLLLFGESQIWSSELQVPHPRMVTRRFVLEPANEIAAGMVHPENGWTISELFIHLQNADPNFCILAQDRAYAQSLARIVCEATGSTLVSAQPPFAGSDADEALQWHQEAIETLSRHRENLAGMPIISSFWPWEPWLVDDFPVPHDTNSLIAPKLLMVVDDKQSRYGALFSRLGPSMHVPVVYLSRDPNEAIQDAVGAVVGMTM